jgi:hypothetical protein
MNMCDNPQNTCVIVTCSERNHEAIHLEEIILESVSRDDVPIQIVVNYSLKVVAIIERNDCILNGTLTNHTAS